MLNKIIISLYAIASLAFAQGNYPVHNSTIVPYWVEHNKGWWIGSDWGPRNAKGATSFHEGIDYTGNKGHTIRAIETGNITEVKYDKTQGNSIWVANSSGRVWGYLHMFQNPSSTEPYTQEDPFIISSEVEYLFTIPFYLVDPNNPTNKYRIKDKERFIALWIGDIFNWYGG
jgi:hypothetical protein